MRTRSAACLAAIAHFERDHPAGHRFELGKVHDEAYVSDADAKGESVLTAHRCTASWARFG